MPAIYHRKLMKHGSSRVVAMPPEWLEANNLKNGGKVTLILDGNEIRVTVEKEGDVYGETKEEVVRSNFVERNENES